MVCALQGVVMHSPFRKGDFPACSVISVKTYMYCTSAFCTPGNSAVASRGMACAVATSCDLQPQTWPFRCTDRHMREYMKDQLHILHGAHAFVQSKHANLWALSAAVHNSCSFWVTNLCGHKSTKAFHSPLLLHSTMSLPACYCRTCVLLICAWMPLLRMLKATQQDSFAHSTPMHAG